MAVSYSRPIIVSWVEDKSAMADCLKALYDKFWFDKLFIVGVATVDKANWGWTMDIFDKLITPESIGHWARFLAGSSIVGFWLKYKF